MSGGTPLHEIGGVDPRRLDGENDLGVSGHGVGTSGPLELAVDDGDSLHEPAR
jgi:hypothetical protein